MSAVSPIAGRHDWWWMDAGFVPAAPAAGGAVTAWRDAWPDGPGTVPRSALESAFLRAMHPFAQLAATLDGDRPPRRAGSAPGDAAPPRQAMTA